MKKYFLLSQLQSCKWKKKRKLKCSEKNDKSFSFVFLSFYIHECWTFWITYYFGELLQKTLVFETLSEQPRHLKSWAYPRSYTLDLSGVYWAGKMSVTDQQYWYDTNQSQIKHKGKDNFKISADCKIESYLHATISCKKVFQSLTFLYAVLFLK